MVENQPHRTSHGTDIQNSSGKLSMKLSLFFLLFFRFATTSLNKTEISSLVNNDL